jgi:ribosome-binding factor A
MAKTKRVYQVGERIREIIAEQLLRSADPRFSLVTVTSAIVSPDLRQAKVYWVVSALNPADRETRREEVTDAFESAVGMFRRVVAAGLGARVVPALRFYYDDTLDTAQQIEEVLARIPKSEQE